MPDEHSQPVGRAEVQAVAIETLLEATVRPGVELAKAIDNHAHAEGYDGR